MKDNWKEEFDEKFLNYVQKHQSKFLLPKNPSNQDTLEWLWKIERSLDKDIRDFIQEALTTQKESFIKIIRETRKNIWAGLHERQEWAIKDEVIEHIDKMIAELEREDR